MLFRLAHDHQQLQGNEGSQALSPLDTTTMKYVLSRVGSDVLEHMNIIKGGGEEGGGVGARFLHSPMR